MSLFAVLACAGGAPSPAPSAPPPTPPPSEPAPAPEPSATPAPPPPAEPIDAAAVPGTWVGKACGDRKWVRTFEFAAGGTYHGQDPVSPCPPDVACVWSGIINFEGTWAVTDGKALTLTEKPAQMAAQFQRPPSLTLAGGVLYDPTGCAYEHHP